MCILWVEVKGVGGVSGELFVVRGSCFVCILCGFVSCGGLLMGNNVVFKSLCVMVGRRDEW